MKTKTVGTGPVYQGRYKSFLIQEGVHLLTVLRYVERNLLTAHLVNKSDEWEYSSVYRRYHGTEKAKQLLALWSIPEPEDYLKLLNQSLTPKEYERIACSKEKGVPCGSDAYMLDMVEQHNLQSTQRGRGGPKSD